jgi:carnitine O-acetyltransferase
MLEGTGGKEAELVEKMKVAAGAHTSFTKLCQSAKACDRHLYGLSQMLMPKEKCDMMSYPLYKKSGTWEISTSNVSNDFYEGFGFGQVCSYGIGCGYIIKADKIIYNCTTRRDKSDGSPEKMCEILTEVLNEMKALVEASQ